MRNEEYLLSGSRQHLAGLGLRSRAKAPDIYLLVAYPVIGIHGKSQHGKHTFRDPRVSAPGSLQGMLHCLYCTVLYCTVLYCTVLYCTLLWCILLQVLTIGSEASRTTTPGGFYTRV